MNIDEILEIRKKAEKDILKTVKEFEENTKLIIDNIELQHFYSGNGKSEILDAVLDIRLGR